MSVSFRSWISRFHDVFQLSDLAKMYSCLLEQPRGHVPGRVISTREITLLFSGDIGATLHFTQSRDYDTEAMHLAKTAVLVRKELLYYIRNNALMVHLILTVSGLQYLLTPCAGATDFIGTTRHEQK